ncbi:MAG: TlpA family protein disulfide reductase [Solirubrobacterales bacterium]
MAAILVVLALAGCGGSEDDPSRPAPSAADFPATKGRTLPQLAEGVNESRLVVSPAGQEFEVGPNRYSFGVFTLGRKQVPDADVALYFAPGKRGKAIGPFPAAIRSLETPPAYRAATSVEGPEATTAVYVVPEVKFTAPGEWRAIALLRTPGGLEGTRMPSAVVGRSDAVPDVGEKPPRIHTPTAEDVGGNLEKIDTRIPPDQMHQVDFADALGQKPIVLLFSTPQFCESRVCGPVVDIAEQIRDEAGDEVAFIHMEVFKENDPSRGARSQLGAFGLRTEPWLFVVDKNGTIDTRIEGAFGAEELREAVSRVTEQ